MCDHAAPLWKWGLRKVPSQFPQPSALGWEGIQDCKRIPSPPSGLTASVTHQFSGKFCGNLSHYLKPGGQRRGGLRSEEGVANQRLSQVELSLQGSLILTLSLEEDTQEQPEHINPTENKKPAHAWSKQSPFPCQDSESLQWQMHLAREVRDSQPLSQAPSG